jgi:hypothetical protein
MPGDLKWCDSNAEGTFSQRRHNLQASDGANVGVDRAFSRR